MKTKEVKKFVRERYGKIAKQGGSCFAPNLCCGGGGTALNISKMIGYAE